MSAQAGPSTRTMLVWCPDWPVIAHAKASGVPEHAPLALIERGEVFACSAAARRDGVRRGLRVREAQARSPSLVVQPYDETLDHRVFEPVILAIEALVPGVQVVRPGTSLVAARGPARYYGGEGEAARVVLRALAELGVTARVGIADGPFAAERAARAARMPHAAYTVGAGEGGHAGGADAIGIVPAGESVGFLAPMPVETLGRPELTTMLRRLGIRTLGDFAALGAEQVRDRFGLDGTRAHLLAAGLDPSAVDPRTPPPDLDAAMDFEPPLDQLDQVAFAFRLTAERFTEALTAASLVATAITVEIVQERGASVYRTWRHPRWFTAGDVIDRVRWQAAGSGAAQSGLSSAVARVVVSPAAVDSVSNHETGLWGNGADERIHNGLARVQSMLGHEAVLTAMLSGGRMLADRAVFVPWGDVPSGGAASVRDAQQQPWPGRLPGPSPATVFSPPRPVTVQGANGAPVDIDDRGALTAPPALFAPGNRGTAGVDAWAGPWPVTERWWDPTAARRLNRFQLVDATGSAWLLVLENHNWFAEGFYD